MLLLRQRVLRLTPGILIRQQSPGPLKPGKDDDYFLSKTTQKPVLTNSCKNQ